MPEPGDVEALTEFGVVSFVNLVERDVEGSDYDAGSAAVERIPIPDFGVPSMEEMRDALDAIDSGLRVGKVYVHCRAGIGRTGTVVGCWLVRHGLASNDAAVAEIAAMREEFSLSGVSPETPEQRAFIAAWKERQ